MTGTINNFIKQTWLNKLKCPFCELDCFRKFRKLMPLGMVRRRRWFPESTSSLSWPPDNGLITPIVKDAIGLGVQEI